MTDRKPPGVRWESFVDKQIREAEARDEFDDLPGKGKPIPGLDGSRDELWWVKRKLRDEGVDDALPPTLLLRKQVDRAKEAIAAATTEEQVRAIVADINEKIRHVNRTAVSGPPTTLMSFDVDEVVARWAAASG